MALTKVQNELVKVWENGPLGFRNRIINGAMEIDQRNAGTPVTLGSSGVFVVDRFRAWNSTDGTMIAEQVEEAPEGFYQSIKFTTTIQDNSLSANQYCMVQQRIEGYNVIDFGFGNSTAKSVTLSFWVRSNRIGTFGGSLENNSDTRSYPFAYVVFSENVWEKKLITISGDTTGSWVKDNGVGIKVNFGLGVGSSYIGVAGSWTSSNLVSAVGSTSIIGSTNATWQITGVQLEEGSYATPFERRLYSQELSMCQRYYQKVSMSRCFFAATSSTTVVSPLSIACSLRSLPIFSGSVGQLYRYDGTNVSVSGSNHSVSAMGSSTVDLSLSISGSLSNNSVYWGTIDNAALIAEL